MAVAKTVSKSKKQKATGGKPAQSAKAAAVAKATARVAPPKGRIQNQATKAKPGKGVQPASTKSSSKGGKITSTLKNLLMGSGVPAGAKGAKASARPASASAKSAAAAKAAPAPAKSKAASTAPAKATPSNVKAGKSQPAPVLTVPAEVKKAVGAKTNHAAGGKAAPAVAQSQKPAKAAGVSSSAAVAHPKSAVKRAVGRAGASPTAHGAALEGVCREVACENLATTGGYCRLHYIKNWKKIKRKEAILKEGRLNQYIEELVSKYPDKYIEAIRQDLASIKEFLKVISDLDLDEGTDEFEGEGGEQVEGIIDNIRREFDDETETF